MLGQALLTRQNVESNSIRITNPDGGTLSLLLLHWSTSRTWYVSVGVMNVFPRILDKNTETVHPSVVSP